MIERIVGVLLIDNGSHPLERGHDLIFAYNAVLKPICNVLARDAESCAVFHQANVIDVGNLRAADAPIDSAHHISENFLGVVIELLLDLFRRLVRAGGNRNC